MTTVRLRNLGTPVTDPSAVEHDIGTDDPSEAIGSLMAAWEQEHGERPDVEIMLSDGMSRRSLQDKNVQARTQIRNAYRDWPQMTAQQKDAANRNLLRAMANVLGWVSDANDAGD